MRQKGRKGERDGGRTDGEADTINFVPISELGFVPSEASLSSAPRSNIQLTPTFPPVFFRGTGCFMHLCGIVECRLQNGASCKAQNG